MKCNYLAVSFHAKAINNVILERFIEYLDLGLVFGDYEADEGTSAAVGFSEYKSQGKNPMYFGRALAGC